jgi:hypothetical protein
LRRDPSIALRSEESCGGLYCSDRELHRRLAPHLGWEKFKAAVRTCEQLKDFPRVSSLWRGRYFPAVKAWLDQGEGLAEHQVAHRTDWRISMPPRGKTPGLKRGRHGLIYWIASQVRRDTMGFPDKCIPLPSDVSDEMLVQLCHENTARLDSWIAEQNRAAELDGPMAGLRTRYDGTVRSACRIYQEHPHSPFRGVKHNTRRTYEKDLRLIEATVGMRLIRNLTILDCKHWYEEWRKPDPERPEKGERIDRAHDGIAMFRTVIYFMAALRNRDCKQLAGELERVKFEKGGAREQELTYAQAVAFIKTAMQFERDGIMPPGRALNVAIGTIAQFELLLRQMDIVGEWAATNAIRRLPQGITTLELEGEIWAGFFTWENIAGWRWRMKTSKSKYRSAADFDLTKYSLLLPLLEAVPLERRAGAVVIGAKRLPVRRDMYARWFRQIARAAGIPDEVWNMDARAGGATEADEAEAPLEAIQSALTHTKETTTLRFAAWPNEENRPRCRCSEREAEGRK